MCSISGMPCWSLVPIVQPPPWTCSITGARSVLGSRRPVDVEQPTPAVVDVRDVLEDLDLLVAHPERHRELAERSREVEVVVVLRQLVAVVVAEPLAQRPVHVGLRPLGLRDQRAQPGHAAGSQRQAGAAAATGRLTHELADRVQRGDRQQVGSELRGEPAAEHRGNARVVAGHRLEGVQGHRSSQCLASREGHTIRVTGMLERVPVHSPTNRTCFNSVRGCLDGTTVRSRRELPLPGDARADDARVRHRRPRPGDDPRRLQLQRLQGRAARAGERDPVVPPQAPHACR